MVDNNTRSENPWDKLAVYLAEHKDFSKEHIIDPAVVETLPEENGLLIAEEGAGVGLLAGKLADRGNLVHALDYSGQMLRASATHSKLSSSS